MTTKIMLKKSYSTICKVRFNHCDPAGIVFYPRYFEMLSAAVEDYFENVLGTTHAEICNQGKGIPLVSVNLDFLKPSYLGDCLNLKLLPETMGRSSVKFKLEITLDNDGELRVVGDFVLVYIDLKKQRSESFPVNIVNKFKNNI